MCTLPPRSTEVSHRIQEQIKFMIFGRSSENPVVVIGSVGSSCSRNVSAALTSAVWGRVTSGWACERIRGRLSIVTRPGSKQICETNTSVTGGFPCDGAPLKPSGDTAPGH